MRSTSPLGLAAAESARAQTQPLPLPAQRVGAHWLSEQSQKLLYSCLVFKPEEEAYPEADLLERGLCPSCLPKNACGNGQIAQPSACASLKGVILLASVQMKGPAWISCHALFVGDSGVPYVGGESNSQGICDLKTHVVYLGFPCGSVGKESTYNAGNPGLIPRGRYPGERNGNPLQYSWSSLVAQTVKNLPAIR